MKSGTKDPQDQDEISKHLLAIQIARIVTDVSIPKKTFNRGFHGWTRIIQTGILDEFHPRPSHHSGEAPLCLRASVVSLLLIYSFSS